MRGHVAWALGRLGGEAAQQALQQAAQSEKDAYVLGEIRAALDSAGTAYSASWRLKASHLPMI